LLREGGAGKAKTPQENFRNALLTFDEKRAYLDYGLCLRCQQLGFEQIGLKMVGLDRNLYLISG